MRGKAILTLTLGAALGISGGLLAPIGAAETVGEDAHLPPPEQSLQEAREATPFELKMPARLPGGMELFHVVWAGPDMVDGVAIASVDLWYSAGDRVQVHVWQTNNPFLAREGKDVAAMGSAVAIDGRSWRQQSTFRGLAFSRRFVDGITVSVDGPIDESELRSIAASIS